VLDYDELIQEEGYKVLDVELKVKTVNGLEVTTTRCPIRVDGKLLLSGKGAPLIGEHNRQIDEEFIEQPVPVRNKYN
jgi:crotonobetainyl-CoA:carnitine CoA-transferase CaiB-like acyl-CoA transferase